MTTKVEFIKIENEWIEATISNYGAHLVSLIYKPLNRKCVCGFMDEQPLKKQTFYLGACVGRVANRIHKGQFQLNNTLFQLDINNGINHLHGGLNGFHQHYFNLTKVTNSKCIARLYDEESLTSYPGDIHFEIEFSCVDESLCINMQAVSNKDTLFDPTLHSYFNLNKNHAKTIRNHFIQLNSDEFYGLDESGCTENKRIRVTELFNPSVETQIETILKQRHPQLIAAKGIDHYFLKRDKTNQWLLSVHVDDLMLEVFTSHSGAHIYSGNYLESSSDLKADFLQENGGICFETHHIPNSINFDVPHAPILKANEVSRSLTCYKFHRRNT